MVRVDKSTWKANYFTKITQLLDEYSRCFIVGADNVGSKQMQEIRMSLRGCAVVLMGKNTMMRKAIRAHLENNPALEKWVDYSKINVLIFKGAFIVNLSYPMFRTVFVKIYTPRLEAYPYWPCLITAFISILT